MKSPIRIGVVEIGSRAIRLLIADHRPGEGLDVAATDSTESKLATALSGDRDAKNQILANVGLTAASYVERCRTMQAKRICVFGTEALRQLAAPQLKQLKQRVPELVVLDAAREAQCSLFAAAYGTRGGKVTGEVAAIDQGAASMEIALGACVSGKLQLKATASHRLGTQPLVELLAASNGDLKAFRSQLESKVAALELMPHASAVRPILLGSAATKLAWISVRRRDDDRYDPRLVHGTELAVDKIDQLVGIAELKPDFVRQVIDPRRPDSTEYETVITGLLALRLVLKRLNSSSFSVSAFGTRHGMAWQLIEAE